MSDVPLELNTGLLTKFNLNSEEDKYLDISQICNYLLGNNNLNFLYHDNATKLFSSIFNNPDYDIFEILVKNLLVEFMHNGIPLEFYHIKNTVDEDEYPFTHYYTTATGVKTDTDTFYKTTKKKVKKQIIEITNPPPFSFTANICVLCLFEYDEGSFGHYGAMFFNGIDTIHIFDSMMKSVNNKIQLSAYNFRDIFVKKLFDTTGLYFVNDLYTEQSTKIYSLEITGGSYNVMNPLISKSKARYANSFKQYVLGVDNQNQFCYMWALLYIIINGINIIKEKKNQPLYSFIDLHELIIEKNIIPVVAIKSFILLLLKYYMPIVSTQEYRHVCDLLITEPFFIENFNKIITNNISYNHIFIDNISEFKPYLFRSDQQYVLTNYLEVIYDYFNVELSNLKYYEVPVATNDIVNTHIQNYIAVYSTTYGKNLLYDLSRIGNNVSYKYMNFIFENYEDLNISINPPQFVVINKKPKKGGALQVKKNSKKKTYYKFKNLDFDTIKK